MLTSILTTIPGFGISVNFFFLLVCSLVQVGEYVNIAFDIFKWANSCAINQSDKYICQDSYVEPDWKQNGFVYQMQRLHYRRDQLPSCLLVCFWGHLLGHCSKKRAGLEGYYSVLCEMLWKQFKLYKNIKHPCGWVNWQYPSKLMTPIITEIPKIAAVVVEIIAEFLS